MLEIENVKFHSLNVADSLDKLNANTEGLSKEIIDERVKQFGLNEILAEETDSPIKQLWAQFSNILIVILLIAAGISLMMGDTLEAISILVIVILAGVLGFVQEFRAGKAIAALKKMAAPLATVIRNGSEVSIESRALVPGDIIILKTGDTVPADARLIEAINLKTEEASLTGESLGVEKNSNVILQEQSALGDRINIVFAGTAISNGRGRALVITTGKDSEFGKIAAMLKEDPNKKTPLQINLDSLGKKIGIGAAVISVIMASIGVAIGYGTKEMFVWGVALAVAVIPEALPAVVTISLALGVRRMVKRRALIRKLPAVETLGAVNIICSDKTGTLTEDQMTVRKIYIDGKIISVTGDGYSPVGKFHIETSDYETDNEHFQTLLKIGILCNDSKLKKDEKWQVHGDPTEGALIVMARKAGFDIDSVKDNNIRVDEYPFNSEKKRMTTFHKDEEGLVAYSKGAGEIILNNCANVLTSEEIKEMTPSIQEHLSSIIAQFGKESLRVIGLSYKKIKKDEKHLAEQEMVFVGFAAMIDPPRKEAIKAIRDCKNAGIKPIMITGDHKMTAVAIARELGILNKGTAFSGEEIEKMDDAEFARIIENAEVFARISPAHKMKIVEILMAKGNVVAMTGDGVNDAPSLKKASIGVAMGITGTDVSKEASDMILTDDNFASIVSAVEEGRTIFENIRKYLVYLLSGNMGTVLGVITAMVAGLPLPLTAVQILFINFIMDGFIALALGVEGPEKGIMNKRPRNVSEGIINLKAIFKIALLGFWIALITSGVYMWSIQSGISPIKAGTMFFVSLILARIINGFLCRSLEESIFKMNIFTNRSLLGSALLSLMLLVLIIEIELLNKTFAVIPLEKSDWLVAILASMSLIIFSEIIKLVFSIQEKGKNKEKQC